MDGIGSFTPKMNKYIIQLGGPIHQTIWHNAFLLPHRLCLWPCTTTLCTIYGWHHSTCSNKALLQQCSPSNKYRIHTPQPCNTMDFDCQELVCYVCIHPCLVIFPFPLLLKWSELTRFSSSLFSDSSLMLLPIHWLQINRVWGGNIW